DSEVESSSGDFHTEPSGNDFLSNFDQWWRQEKNSAQEPSSLPFEGGWFVFLSYELVAQIEPGLSLPVNGQCEPIAYATRIPAALVKEHSSGHVYAVAEDGRQGLIDTMLSHVQQVQGITDQRPDTPVTIKHIAEENPDTYVNGVEKVKEYIRNGDVFQVNLSRWWTVQFAGSLPDAWLYRQLRIHNPSPFFGVAKFGQSTIISSSPERLVKVNQQQISTRPIAGTRPRGDREGEDHQLSDELMAHPKERAEHIMLIDLERNDLGRICTPGSITVDELMVLETYAHVHHIVSNVTGRLRPDVTPGQIIRAMFPGGTITGCPKVRCMEIIAELEAAGRGAYTGSMGYINLNGDMDFNILIRTMVQCGNQVHFRAGAGIVADSVAEKELAETKAKAKGLLNSLGLKYR
ncbi:MAG: aminodeoxychorismate synthase component I, partial [Gammaproteobacteria bacterium]|nr:aminodeoxychorismate synthase component I [Gammaproteobacteria bacterium]